MATTDKKLIIPVLIAIQLALLALDHFNSNATLVSLLIQQITISHMAQLNVLLFVLMVNTQLMSAMFAPLAI